MYWLIILGFDFGDTNVENIVEVLVNLNMRA